jgi:hypothetical protein
MIETTITILVFTIVGVWYVGHQPAEMPNHKRSPLMTPKLYAGLFVLAILLVLLWR